MIEPRARWIEERGGIRPQVSIICIYTCVSVSAPRRGRRARARAAAVHARGRGPLRLRAESDIHRTPIERVGRDVTTVAARGLVVAAWATQGGP